MNEENEYECALSGEIEEGFELSEAPLGDLPPGWTKITLQRRVFNPRWVSIQETKQVLMQQALTQLGITPEDTGYEAAFHMISMQIDANWHSMESATPKFETEEEVLYLSNTDEVLEAYNSLRAQLQLDAIELDDGSDESHLPHDGEVGDDPDDDDDDDDDDDTGEEEAEEE